MSRVFRRALVSLTLLLAPLAGQTGVMPAPKAEMVILDKSERRLLLVNKDKVLRRYRVALGGNPVGHKLRRGDGRTPEGVYTLEKKRPHSRFYRAIQISYPNERDRLVAKARGLDPGGNIMIHGQPNQSKVPEEYAQQLDWTRGCVAVTNEQMDEIWDSIDEGTKIVILP